jgi:DNA-binding GntR family transcriptional regulator
MQRKTPDSQTLAERLAGELADEILSGALVPGTKLDEQSLADRYQVSRTPVREALRQLGTTGLIESRPRRGAIVTQITSDQLQDLFVAMGELEATCARLSALSMTPIERRKLSALHDEMGTLASSANTAKYAEANVEFHSTIYAGAHNAVISDLAITLRRRLAAFRRAQFRAKGRLARSHAEHATVVAAIVRGDADAAHAAMLHHVSLVEDAFDRLIASARQR